MDDKTLEFEKIIIKVLFVDEDMRSKIIPNIKVEWFMNIDIREIVNVIISFVEKYGQMPNVIEMGRLIKDEDTSKVLKECLMIPDEDIRTQFILEEIEEFVKRRLVFNVAQSAYNYSSKHNSKKPNGSFADLMSDAESFSFDTNVGFDFFEEPSRLYHDANVNEKIIKCGLKNINDLIGGGFHEKSLNLFLASTNIGKTLIMCSFATDFILSNYNVLYVTFEDPENKIATRVAQNMFDVTQSQLKQMSEKEFQKAFDQTRSKIKDNRFIIKEFPEGTINATALKSLIKELKDKRDFIPDVLIIDYIGCMIPNGKYNSNLNSNTTLQLISLQVRALAMELSMPIISGLQTNRGGYGQSHIGLDQVADSYSSTTKADAIFGITQTEECQSENFYFVQLLKTRYGNQRNKKIMIGVDIEKQRIYDIDQNEHEVNKSNVFDSRAMATISANNDDNDDDGFNADDFGFDFI